MTSIGPSAIASHIAGPSSSGTQKPSAKGPFFSMFAQSLVTNIANGLASAVTGRPCDLAWATIRMPSRVDRCSTCSLVPTERWNSRMVAMAVLSMTPSPARSARA